METHNHTQRLKLIGGEMGGGVLVRLLYALEQLQINTKYEQIAKHPL